MAHQRQTARIQNAPPIYEARFVVYVTVYLLPAFKSIGLYFI